MDYTFLQKYKSKIKSISEILKILSKNKQKKKSILCHGVFDVVHPGHLRHLAFAKTKAPILIVSLTADKHIKKGVYRPHVPENLRALNIAAFDFVDYVIIDKNAKPLELLKKVKPYYFAKGFEYSKKGFSEATKEEIKVIKSYKGKIIFTPGDVVYSSSNLLNYSAPNINIEKLSFIMQNNGITFDQLKKICKSFSSLSVDVIGDTIVDTYTRTNLIGGQTKTPTFSLLYQKEDHYVGGAAIVAQHLKAAGANVQFSTVLGKDSFKNFILNRLKHSKINVNYVTDENRPTTNKNSIVTGIYKILKVDKLDNSPVPGQLLDKLSRKIKKNKSDIIIFSDFRHGIFNSSSIKKLINLIPKKKFKAADSQVASRWGNITEFKNFNLITPNEKEARFALADQDTTVGNLATILSNKTNFKNLILKLGDKGVFCMTSEKKIKNNYFSLGSFAENVIDAVGSGDALLAYSSLALKKSGSIIIASILGSIAAALECEKDGNIPIKANDVLNRLNKIEKKLKYST
ncbi:PfkB family carbohydrate kinase [Candidatus Pelagibacter sp.]|uniref:PfkB family carbohydrate kinase n=1 Tax=Candidatus Pelagibacter sp. TaxID=2024849 RepID=UPI003D0A227E